MTTQRKGVEARNESRPTRIPVSGEARNVLTITNADPNFVYRWVNDSVDRVSRFLTGGYEFVIDPHMEVGDGTDPSDARSIGAAVSRQVGNGMVSYLMRIKREFYLEDQAAKAQSIQTTEQAMKQTVEGGRGRLQFD
jgi:hypothetical protein